MRTNPDWTREAGRTIHTVHWHEAFQIAYNRARAFNRRFVVRKGKHQMWEVSPCPEPRM